MPRKLLSHALAAIALALTTAACADELCALVPNSYMTAKQTHPQFAAALAQIEKHSIATWYSDRNGDYAATLRQLVTSCSESTRLSTVVYGIPNKDCEAGYSSSGSTVKTAADYLKFLTDLRATVGNRKALYVLEPDAVGLLAKDGGCGEAAGYRENLKTAIKTLSSNPNADIYLDVGYWTLQYASSLSRVAAVVKELAGAGRVKGIAINTSNYRSNAELAALCSAFQTAMGSTAYRCVVDTSRNFVAPTSNEWCNVKTAGIGHPPTSNTGYSNLDYFMWIKPPGESDGECNGGSHAAESLRGPAAGLFFEQAFALLWDQGYFVKELGVPTIRGSDATPTPAPTTTVPETQAPETLAPETLAPATQMPATQTPATQTPATQTPATQTPATQTPETPAPATQTPATQTPATQTPETPVPATQTPATQTPVSPSPIQQHVTPEPPSVESPVTATPDLPTAAPTTEVPNSIESPFSVASPAPIVTSPKSVTSPTPTPCVDNMARNVDVSQQAAPSSISPEPTTAASSTATASPDDSARVASTFGPPLAIAPPLASTPATSESRIAIDSTAVDADSSATKHPTPAPTTTHRSGNTEVAVKHEDSNSDSIKQVATETSGGYAGTTAGVFAVFVVIGLVVAIAAYLNAQAKKKQMEESKQSPAQPATNRASKASYLSAL